MIGGGAPGRAVRAVVAGCCALLCLAPGAPAPRAGSSLAVRYDGRWRAWWRSDEPPARWQAPLPAVTKAVVWRRAGDGIEWGELRLAGSGEAWRVRVIVARVDPARVRFRLDSAFAPGLAGARWSIAHAPADAALAVDAGQFVGALPWGWVVLRGRELLPPGAGPLSAAIVIDTAGALQWVSADRIASVRRSPGIVAAFQSYPVLLDGDGTVPRALRESGAGVDLEHRDARVALGFLRDGRVLVALTRFDALDGALDYVPFGLTTPEMAAVMGALGCRRAVMLDGGISSQLLVREADGRAHEWPGARRVPLGLVAVPARGRADAASRREE